MHDTLLGFISYISGIYCNTVCFKGTPTPQKIAWPRDSKIKLSFDILAKFQ